jgi:two-component system, OmpR family, response regulator
MNRQRVIIIDDDPNIRELLSMNIGAAGYEIQTAENGREGLAMINREPPNLIVLDVMMPDMDGYELCKIVRDRSDLQSIKILMLTAKDAPRDKMIGKEILQADEYITKPFEIAYLLSAIGRLLAET